MPNINLGSMSGIKSTEEKSYTIKDIQNHIDLKREYVKDTIKPVYDKKNYD